MTNREWLNSANVSNKNYALAIEPILEIKKATLDERCMKNDCEHCNYYKKILDKWNEDYIFVEMVEKWLEFEHVEETEYTLRWQLRDMKNKEK